MSLSVQQAWDRFMEERSVVLSASTISTDYEVVKKWLEKCPIQQLDKGREVVTWVLHQQPRASSMRVARYVKTLYKWASSDGVDLVPSNPVASFKFPKPVQRSEIVVIPKGELPIVIGALRRRSTTYCAQWDQLARFMAQTGLRSGEARAVRIGDVQGDRLLVHANYTLKHGLKPSTKTNKQRFVPLNEIAKEVLMAARPDSEGFVFPWSREAFMSYFEDRMRELHQQGKIAARYRPYDLRHTAISRWLEAGIPIAQCAAWAGNSAEVIWQHYAAVTESYEMPVV